MITWTGFTKLKEAYLDVEDNLLPLDALLELPHTLDELVVVLDTQVARCLVGIGLGRDLAGIFKLGSVDDQPSLLALLDNNDPERRQCFQVILRLKGCARHLAALRVIVRFRLTFYRQERPQRRL